jgi:hypothetical protein
MTLNGVEYRFSEFSSDARTVASGRTMHRNATPSSTVFSSALMNTWSFASRWY